MIETEKGGTTETEIEGPTETETTEEDLTGKKTKPSTSSSFLQVISNSNVFNRNFPSSKVNRRQSEMTLFVVLKTFEPLLYKLNH